jgi:hypothetical protein
MCGDLFAPDPPDIPPPPPPPEPTPTFQAGSELDTASVNSGASSKKGKDQLKTDRSDSGLGIPVDA